MGPGIGTGTIGFEGDNVGRGVCGACVGASLLFHCHTQYHLHIWCELLLVFTVYLVE